MEKAVRSAYAEARRSGKSVEQARADAAHAAQSYRAAANRHHKTPEPHTSVPDPTQEPKSPTIDTLWAARLKVAASVEPNDRKPESPAPAVAVTADAAQQQPAPSPSTAPARLERLATSIALGLRKWTQLSERGQFALAACATSRSRLDYAAANGWGALRSCQPLHVRVQVAALASLREAEAELSQVMQGLEAAVGGMREVVDSHVARAAARDDDNDTEARGLAAECVRAVSLLERELEVRAGVALSALQGGGSRRMAHLSRELGLSAWSLEVFASSREMLELLGAYRVHS